MTTTITTKTNLSANDEWGTITNYTATTSGGMTNTYTSNGVHTTSLVWNFPQQVKLTNISAYIYQASNYLIVVFHQFFSTYYPTGIVFLCECAAAYGYMSVHL